MSDLELAQISLSQAKEHARVLHNRDDALIEGLIPAALMLVSQEIDRPLNDPACLTNGVLNPTLRLAALMIVNDLYRNREAQQDVDLKRNATVDRLLSGAWRAGV